MSGETQQNESGWSVDTLKVKLEADTISLEKLMNRRFIDNDKALKAALLAVKEDNGKIAIAMEKRFDSVNEFRNQQRDIIASFLPRLEHDAQMKATNDRLDELTTRMNLTAGATKGAQQTRSNQIAAIGAVGIIIGILGAVFALRV